MATRATYYFDGLNFATAIALFTDQALTTKAADGYYSLGTISRRQVNGFLQSAANCTNCGDAISLCYDTASASEVCCVGCGTTYTSFASTVTGVFNSVCGDTTFDQTFYHNGPGQLHYQMDGIILTPQEQATDIELQITQVLWLP